jgi:hypothetical protein
MVVAIVCTVLGIGLAMLMSRRLHRPRRSRLSSSSDPFLLPLDDVQPHHHHGHHIDHGHHVDVGHHGDFGGHH